MKLGKGAAISGGVLATLAIASMAVLLTTACKREPQAISSSNTGGIAAPSNTPASAEREVELVVDGMHCATCPITVRTAAKAVPGVIDARVTTDPGRAWVRYRPSQTAPGPIAVAITEAGYPAHEASR